MKGPGTGAWVDAAFKAEHRSRYEWQRGMRLSIDPSDSTPPFEQLRAQIVAAIAIGELLPGARLPTVRGLAAELGLAPNTVAKTYRELERRGVVETRGRQGTTVKSALPRAELDASIAAREFALRMRDFGLSTAEALELARSALEAAEPLG